jgi:hypothetical protein
MRKSRLLAIMSALAVLVAMVLVVGCGSSDDDSSSSSSSSDSVSSELITEGTLTVGTDTPYPPFEFGKAPDYDGFDIDMTNAIAWLETPPGHRFRHHLHGCRTGVRPVVASVHRHPERQQMSFPTRTTRPSRLSWLSGFDIRQSRTSQAPLRGLAPPVRRSP